MKLHYLPPPPQVSPEAQEYAKESGVTIFTADIIYHLFDQFTAYMKRVKEATKAASVEDAVFPVILKIMPNCIFNKKDPIVLGVEVVDGIAKVGTPLCVYRGPDEIIDLGKIASMERDHKATEVAKKGQAVAMKVHINDNFSYYSYYSFIWYLGLLQLL